MTCIIRLPILEQTVLLRTCKNKDNLHTKDYIFLAHGPMGDLYIHVLLCVCAWLTCYVFGRLDIGMHDKNLIIKKKAHYAYIIY